MVGAMSSMDIWSTWITLMCAYASFADAPNADTDGILML